MGNSFGGKRSVKIMKVNGETFKLKTPVQAGSVLVKHPGHVLLASEAVVHYGARAKPLEPHEELKPRRLYFLVELPKLPKEKGDMRRVRSGIHMTAKDRLETLMLARRSASDISATKTVVSIEEREGINVQSGSGGVRVRLRLPKAEVERLMAESKDGADVAEKIAGLCMAGGATAEQNVHWSGHRGLARQRTKSRE
ncbi:plastid movement impaired protein, partial [Perilla frutescens var. hirtella]